MKTIVLYFCHLLWTEIDTKMKVVQYYHVGGSVRDILSGEIPHDLDIAVEASSFQEMIRDLEAKNLKIYNLKEEFFIVRASCQDAKFLECKYFEIIKKTSCDFVLCRQDGFYRDGRRPDQVTVGL